MSVKKIFLRSTQSNSPGFGFYRRVLRLRWYSKENKFVLDPSAQSAELSFYQSAKFCEWGKFYPKKVIQIEG